MQYRASIGYWQLFCSIKPKHESIDITCITFLYIFNCFIKSARFRGKSLPYTIMISLLLLVSGDIHPNPGPTQTLKMCQINMRSLQPSDRSVKLDEMYSMLVLENQFDIICVSETWLDSSISDAEVELYGYQLFRNDRNRHGGGVAIYAHNSLPVKKSTNVENFDIECVAVELKLNTKRFIILSCYRPPSSRSEGKEFIENFQNLINGIYVEGYDSIFLLGDFNDRCLDWSDDHRNSELGLEFKESIENNLLFQIISEPTYISHNYQSFFDLIITDSPGYVQNSGVGFPIGDP